MESTSKEHLFKTFYNKGILKAKEGMAATITTFMHNDTCIVADRIHDYIMHCYDRSTDEDNISNIIIDNLSSLLITLHDNIDHVTSLPGVILLRQEFILRAIGQHIKYLSDSGDCSFERFIPGILSIVDWTMDNIDTDPDDNGDIKDILEIVKKHTRVQDGFLDTLYGITLTLHDTTYDFLILLRLYWISQGLSIMEDYTRFCKYLRLFFPMDFIKLKEYLIAPADRVDTWVEATPIKLKEVILNLK